ncbi:DNA adenine methylase [Allorhizobium undicola]|uniref:DNA adenine methylase n=1 Tax=Allorhizobium undicola TaxID=78527 RepID=UPI000684AFC4|nr:DNA adenine methylase [Allorhizobium undicola]
MKLPHPIPYQGSKRSLAPLIAPYVPKKVATWYEPFAGSAAMTLWAAHNQIAERYVIGDVLAPIADLWRVIINHPDHTAARYSEVWQEQMDSDEGYFNAVRDRYNEQRDPVDLLYLICRCVKNAIRFNTKSGNFTQSRDKRRLGMRPEKMAEAILGASMLLSGKTEVYSGDWTSTLATADASDFVYMDPPYLGTTIGRDKRYAEGLPQDRLISGLENLRARNIRFALSYDGMTGGKEYGPPLPDSLGLTRLLLHAGKSSQATLVGRDEETVESLYITPDLGDAVEGVIRRQRAIQTELAF